MVDFKGDRSLRRCSVRFGAPSLIEIRAISGMNPVHFSTGRARAYDDTSQEGGSRNLSHYAPRPEIANFRAAALECVARVSLIFGCGRGGAMSKSSLSWLALIVLAVSVCAVLPSRGQNRGQNQAVQLPEGDGKATVQAACGVCHSMNTVTNSGHDREEWTTVLHMMVNVGAPVPEDQFETVVGYLSKNFPEKPQPPAKIIPGNVDVSIKEWMGPAPGSRPHDPMFAPDGSAWYSGQMANVLGRFDPKTEQFKEYKLPPKS